MVHETATTPDQQSALRRRLVFWFSAVLVAMFGVLIGIGAFTFGYGKGWSYLSNNPTTCANCHVMQGHYDSWQSSSHRHVAVCNDCHLEIEWGRVMLERPHFEKEGVPPHPDDSYTVESVLSTLCQAIEQLGAGIK